MYTTAEQMQELIDVYFANTPEIEITITGLALALGFHTRLSLINYQGKPEFMNTVKNAKLRVEHSYEIALRNNGRAGEIFGLKNFGWDDKSISEHQGGVTFTRIERVVVDTKEIE